MTGSRQPQLNEELLSAYLDDEVTAEERALVEAAIAADPAIAWQIESLRQTVHLLQALPPLALPRSFTLEAVMADGQAMKGVTAPQTTSVQPHAARGKPSTVRPTSNEQQGHWWQWLWQIWQGGNLQLRNAAAVAFTLLIVLVLSDRFVPPTPLRQPTVIPAPAAKVFINDDSAVTASAAIVMTTAPIETATNLAETTSATPLAVAAYGITETPAPTVKAAPDENIATAPRAAQLPPPQPGQPGEDTFDMSGSHGGSFGDQTGQGGSMASVMTDNSQAMAPTGSGPAALKQIAPNEAANQARSASIVTTTAPATVTITATVTGTPTIAVTATVAISNAGPTEAITNTKVLIAPPATSNGARTTSSPATTAWLAWAEMMAGVCTVLLGGLWWRSRGGAHA